MIKKGDIVVLKSGGPSMTVSDIGEHHGAQNMVFCIWFDGPNKKSDVFDMAVLEIFD